MTADAQQVERLRIVSRKSSTGQVWVCHRWPNGDEEAVRTDIIPDLLATAEAHAALVKAVEGLRDEWRLVGKIYKTGFAPSDCADALAAILAATDTAADRGAR